MIKIKLFDIWWYIMERWKILIPVNPKEGKSYKFSELPEYMTDQILLTINECNQQQNQKFYDKLFQPDICLN